MQVILNLVGLTPRQIGEHTPTLAAFAKRYGARPLGGVFPAVTSTAQATLLTGLSPQQHGIVGNGWLFRDTREVRFWQQSRYLVAGEFFYEARQRSAAKIAHLFWWFNQGNSAEITLTPKPYYACDGNKLFGIHGTPPHLVAEIRERFGEFPFASFWGPLASAAASEWIAQTAAYILTNYQPEIALIYLPHLDYDLQRFGATGAHLAENLRTVDAAAKIVIDAANAANAEIFVISEYGITDVERVVYLNRELRAAGLLTVRATPFGEMLECFQSRAFAVVDHQIAHIYIRDECDVAAVKKILRGVAGVGEILTSAGKEKYQINHPRSGELVVLAERNSWLAWNYFYDETSAPDFAFTVDIHRKPGYDPAELFFNENLCCPKLAAAKKLLQKKLGLRTKFDLITHRPERIKGSHGLLPADPQDGAIIIANRELPENVTMTNFASLIAKR